MKIKVILLLGILVLVASTTWAADEGESLTSHELEDEELIEEEMRAEGFINVYDACAEELAALRVGNSSLTMAEAVTAGFLPAQCKDADKCMYNDPNNPTYDPKGNGRTKKTIDHCIWP